jgi:DNA-binding Lrp family transcriptional regulator
MTDAKYHDDADRLEPKQRYVEPKACLKARRRLGPGPTVALDELVRRYRKAANERPVRITVRQLAEACNMSRMSASRAIKTLVDEGFVITVFKASYNDKKQPTSYRLTMFPCDGQDATHDYIEDVIQWRRQRGRRRPDAPLPKTVKVQFEVPTSQAADVVEAVEVLLSRKGEPLPFDLPEAA